MISSRLFPEFCGINSVDEHVKKEVFHLIVMVFFNGKEEASLMNYGSLSEAEVLPLLRVFIIFSLFPRSTVTNLDPTTS